MTSLTAFSGKSCCNPTLSHIIFSPPLTQQKYLKTIFVFECEFLALMFIIVYVGAIAVLFLFIVMMLDIKIATSSKDSLKYFPVGLVIGSIFLIEIFLIIGENFKQNSYNQSSIGNHFTNWYDKLDSFSDIESIGQIMFPQYVLQFLIAGNILLLATVSVVVLTINPSPKNKTQVKHKVT